MHANEDPVPEDEKPPTQAHVAAPVLLPLPLGQAVQEVAPVCDAYVFAPQAA